MARKRYKPEEIVAELRQVEDARPRSTPDASRARRRGDRMKRRSAIVDRCVMLFLKRAAASRLSGEWSDDDYDVLADGIGVGRIMKAAAAAPLPSVEA
jgi:hypothetical protein